LRKTWLVSDLQQVPM